ncbi:phosphotransferase, partial [Streptomyces mirabilis]
MGIPSADWLVRPIGPVDEAEVSAVLAERFGVTGTVHDLGSQQDRNYRVRTGTGDYVLKIANPASDPAALRAQCAAVERLSDAMSGLRLPRAHAGVDGEVVQRLSAGGMDLVC